MTDWYQRALTTLISIRKQSVWSRSVQRGTRHLVLSILGPGDVVLVPDPTYPIHAYSVVIAGVDLRSVPLIGEGDFFQRLLTATKQTWPQPRMIIVSFPTIPPRWWWISIFF